MSAILVAILKNKFDENVCSQPDTVGKNCVKIREFNFLSATFFLHGGHICGHFEKKGSRICSWSRADVVEKKLCQNPRI